MNSETSAYVSMACCQCSVAGDRSITVCFGEVANNLKLGVALNHGADQSNAQRDDEAIAWYRRAFELIPHDAQLCQA